jgi:uncharacterized protein (TIGR03032 family)
MGMAFDGHRLAIGCSLEVVEFHSVPAALHELNQSAPSPSFKPRIDLGLLPKRITCTGDLQIHEMAWAKQDDPQTTASASGVTRSKPNELVFVNTVFSCLATLSDDFSFEPYWRPPFIKQLFPGDACHLNGLGMRDGQPRYVTALGESSIARGWRENKRSGGILIDVESNEILTRGLSMPHSPRWYRDSLWLLESGCGTIGTVDLMSGRYEPVAQLPGFTRGLSFHGPLAFIGVSQVRETSMFSGIPLIERLQATNDRMCGIWVMDIERGEILGFCRFLSGVHEIFGVEALAGSSYPVIHDSDSDLIGRAYSLEGSHLIAVD